MPMQTHRGGGGVALTYSQPCTRTGSSGRVVSTMPQPLYSRKRPSTNCTGGWVGLKADLDDTWNL